MARVEVRGSKKSRRNTEEGHLIEHGVGLRGERALRCFLEAVISELGGGEFLQVRVWG